MQRISLPLILGVSLFGAGLVACGDDGSGDATSGDTETAGDGDGDPTGDGDGDPTGDGDGDPTGDGDGDPSGDGDGDPTGDGDGDPTGDGDGDPTTGDGDGDPSDCQVWEITYDLTDSEFEIDADNPLGDQVNTLEMPYDADDTVGPGEFVLRFQDVDGSPGGTAFMHSYQMSMHFAVSVVNTDLENEALPKECGLTSAALDGTTVAWSPSAIVDHHSVGEIVCTGGAVLCGFANLPNGTPVPVDETSDMPISAFEFSNDLSSFDMAKTAIPGNDAAVTTWTYVGTEVSRELVDAPACLCE